MATESPLQTLERLILQLPANQIKEGLDALAFFKNKREQDLVRKKEYREQRKLLR